MPRCPPGSLRSVQLPLDHLVEMRDRAGVVEDVEMGSRLAGLRCRLRVMLERGRETTGMGLKHMIDVEG